MVTGTSALMIMAQSWEDASMPVTTMMYVKTNVWTSSKHANSIAHARFNTSTGFFILYQLYFRKTALQVVRVMITLAWRQQQLQK